MTEVLPNLERMPEALGWLGQPDFACFQDMIWRMPDESRNVYLLSVAMIECPDPEVRLLIRDVVEGQISYCRSLEQNYQEL